MMQIEDIDGTDRFKLYSIADLLKLPEPDWLVEGLFTTGALVGVYGSSGGGKTFLALDWALTIADGSAWFGRTVRQGPVVYVAAGGDRFISKRVNAWMIHRDLTEIPSAFFLLEGVQVMNDSDIELLAERIKSLAIEPRLIVFDTLARCFVGGDENSANDVGQFVNGLGRLQSHTKAAVIVLHHAGKQSATERGSTAFHGAADAMIRVSKSHSIITVRNDKQKDAEEFQDIKLRLQQVPVPAEGKDGATSCVLEQAHAEAGM